MTDAGISPHSPPLLSLPSLLLPPDSMQPVSAEEERRTFKEHLETIEDNRDHIKSMLQTHGDLILSRWDKKSRQKRASLLVKAAPEIFALLPTLEMLRRGQSGEEPAGPSSSQQPLIRPHGHWFDLPRLLEDRMKLLMLLHLRTSYSPSEWAAFDTQQARDFWDAAGGGDDTMSHGRYFWLTGQSYGEPAEGDDVLTHFWAMADSRRAFLTIRSQWEIMRALRDVVDEIVDGADESGNTKWAALVESGFRRADTAAFNPYTNRAFTPPVQFNLDAMMEKAQPRYQLLLDEVWLMQQYPPYMHYVIDLMKKCIPDDFRGSKAIHQHIATQVVKDLIERFMHWALVCELIQRAKAFRRVHRPGDDPNIALSELGNLLNSQRKTGTHSEQLLRKLCEGSERYHKDPKHKVHTLLTLMGLLRREVNENLDYHPFSTGFGLLDREILQHETAARLVDERTYAYLSDLATNDELYTTWRWSQIYIDRDIPVEEVEKFWSDVIGISRYYDHSAKASSWKSPEEILGSSLAAFAGARWPEGPRDATWLALAEESRKRLATFWSLVRAELRRAEERTGTAKARADNLIKAISFDLDDGFKTLLDAERRECQNQSAQLVAPIDSRSRKKRNKAHFDTVPEMPLEGLVQDLGLEGGATDDPELEYYFEPLIVKHETLLIIHKMFPSSTSKTLESGVQWKHFIEAMADAGFSATEANGLLVSFRDSRGEVNSRDILFSRPHPGTVIEPFVLQYMGKRMKYRFGWDRCCFRERDR